jgi:predicted MFS family arabinose efflux permease
MIAECVSWHVIIVAVLVVSVTVTMAVATTLRESKGTRERQGRNCAAAREE